MPTIWPFMANAASRAVERIDYLTDVIAAADGSEQRIRLRSHQGGLYDFTGMALDSELQRLHGLLYANHALPWYVPLWHLARRLTAAVAPAATAASFDGTFMSVWTLPTVGAALLLWNGPASCEVVTVNTLSSSGATFTGGVVGSYPAGSYAIPVRLGRLAPHSASARVSIFGREPSVAFDLDFAGASKTADDVTPTYEVVQTFDVFESGWMRGLPESDSVEREYNLLAAPTGARVEVVQSAGPSSLFSVHCQTFTQQESYDLREFLDSRAGRLTPFWLSLGTRDLLLAQAQLAADDTLLLSPGPFASSGYAAFMFGSSLARTWLEIRAPGGTKIRRQVTGVTGELLQLDSALGTDVPIGSTVSFLILCRLDSDSVEIEWSGTMVAESRFKVRELPGETPDSGGGSG